MRRTAAAALLSCGLLLVTGCGDDAPLATPVVPSEEPTAAEASSPPSPSPSAEPLSPFEDDPAVIALRAYLAASSEAINAGDLRLPEFTARATAKRQARHAELYAEDEGTFFPGPPPTAVLAVQAVSPAARNVVTCLLDDGFALDREGGSPTEPRLVVPGIFQMIQEGETWKVDAAVRDPAGSCDGVPLPGDPGEAQP